MILFWLICAALVAIALAFVLPPLLQRAGAETPGDGTWGGTRGDETQGEGKSDANLDVYRDQLSELATDLQNGIISPEQYQQDRDSIERRLLEDVPAEEAVAPSPKKQMKEAVGDRGPAYALAIGIPVVALALYLQIGTRGALSGVPIASAPPAAAGPGSGQMSPQAIEANVAALAKRLEQSPEDTQGWIMLGRSYISLEKYGEASNAYAKAAALKPDDADLLGDYAFALAMANGRQLQGQPFELIKKALQLEPKNLKALDLAGSAEFQAKNYKQAVDYWQKAFEVIPADAGEEARTRLSQMIEEAKSLSTASSK